MDIYMVECYQKLAPDIDAFYITAHVGVNIKNLPKLLAPLLKYNVATFSQNRTDEVKHGVLMSLAKQDFQHFGRFHAEIFARILNGAKPRDLPQVFESPQEIAINLETARRIGFRFPRDSLAGAKEIYNHIEQVE
jgi:ABC-type uncharacterized transport system substrate-binding protein